MRSWGIIYPVGIYFVVTAVVLFILDFILPDTIDNSLLRQMITSVAVLPFLYSFYRQDALLWGEQGSFLQRVKLTGRECKIIILLFFGAGIFSLGWNNILGLIGIEEYSASYHQIRETFYMGKLVLEFFAVCVAAPLAEELLYRGIVYKRARDWLGKKWAILLSAMIFGLVHLNLVQFVYAAVFGILLAVFVEETGKLHSAVFAHAAANLTSLLRAETGIFSFMDESRAVTIVMTPLLLLAAAAFFFLAWKVKCHAALSD